MKTSWTQLPPKPRAELPAWALLALGGLFASIVLGSQQAPTPTPPGGLEAKLDLKTACPRELRRLPGIGPTRAAAIAQFRWQRGAAAFELHEIPGIGRTTEQRVLEWLKLGHHSIAGR